jgi:hypothetical protein
MSRACLIAALSTLATAALSGRARAEIRHDMDFLEGGADISQLFFSTSVAPAQDRYLLLSLTTMGPGSRGVSVSYGGAALGLLGQTDSPGGNCHIEWWGVVAPAEGANPLRVTLSATTPNLGVTATSYNGVDQLNPTGPVVPAAGTGAPITVTVPSAPGQVVLDGACGWSPDTDIDRAGPNQTARWHWSFGPHRSVGSQKPGAAAVTLTWSTMGPSALDWASLGLSLRPASDALPPVKLAVDTAGCAVARAGTAKNGGKNPGKNPGLWGGPVPMLAALAAVRALATRRRRRAPPGASAKR